MSCDLSAGLLEPCKAQLGGLDAVYFANNTSLGIPTIVNGEVTGFSEATGTVYKYELKGANGLETSIQSDRNNGTTFFEQVLTLQLKKLTPAQNAEIIKMSQGRFQVFAEDRSGNLLLLGQVRGMEMTDGGIVTGVEMGDLSGYNVTLTGQEKEPAAHVAGYTPQNPFGGLVGTVITIVEGTAS
jgi:hypothetical protein